MLDNSEKLYISAATGALFFMLRKNEIPLWKKIVFFAIGTFAASVTTEAVVAYFNLSPSASGGIGFFCAVIVLPIAETLLELAQNPSKAVALWRGYRGDNTPPQ